MLGCGSGQCLGNFTLRDLAVNDVKRVNLDPDFTTIIHHLMKMRRYAVFEIDVQQAIVEAFDNEHTFSQ